MYNKIICIFFLVFFEILLRFTIITTIKINNLALNTLKLLSFM